mmetsp:Transcript_30629/g.69998  ORF Transcript_30629/g.69998 Transcript_30629/m.69998 type:complete len:223 (+) Transcript_30629:978-1646(+)
MLNIRTQFIDCDLSGKDETLSQSVQPSEQGELNLMRVVASSFNAAGELPSPPRSDAVNAGSASIPAVKGRLNPPTVVPNPVALLSTPRLTRWSILSSKTTASPTQYSRFSPVLATAFKNAAEDLMYSRMTSLTPFSLPGTPGPFEPAAHELKKFRSGRCRGRLNNPSLSSTPRFASTAPDTDEGSGIHSVLLRHTSLRWLASYICSALPMAALTALILCPEQ